MLKKTAFVLAIAATLQAFGQHPKNNTKARPGTVEVQAWSSERSGAKARLEQITDSAQYYGLQGGEYRLPAHSMETHLADSLFTLAARELITDLFRGTNISSYIRNDEISRHFSGPADSFVVKWMAMLRDPADVQAMLDAVLADVRLRMLQDQLTAALHTGDLKKARQLTASLNIWKWILHFRFDTYLVVNIPQARLFCYENGVEKLNMKVIVGKPSTRTPRFASWCDKVILYPYWNVPRSIAVKELLPSFRRNPSRVAAMNMQLLKNGRIVDPGSVNWASLNRSNFPYLVRQCTGCDNALGVIKFNLTDPFDVYMHDTNNKPAFESDHRYYSHGCIRVSRPLDLGNFLLDSKLDINFLRACLKEQDPVAIKLKKPVPVFVVYMTATIEHDTVAYAKDVYHLFR